jgi:hypothetical protein
MKNILQTKNSITKILVLIQSLFFLFCVFFSVNAQDNDLPENAQANDLKLINKVPKHLPLKGSVSKFMLTKIVVMSV